MGLASLFLVLPLLASVLSSPTQKKIDSGNNCDHPDCYVFDAEVAAGVDWSASPCDNFYQFACGRWLKHVDNPQMLPLVDPLRLQQAQLNNRLKELFATNVSKEEVALGKAQQFYISCIQQEQFMKENFEVIKERVEQLGGWPLASGEDNNISNIISSFVLQKDLKVPFKISVKYLPANNTISYVQILPPSNANLLTTPFPSLTAENILTIANTLFSVKDQESALEDAKGVLQLDKELKEAITENNTEVTATIQDHRDLIHFDFTSILNKVFDGIKKFSPEDKIIITSPRYFQRLFDFIKQQDNARIVSNYMIFHDIIYPLLLVGDSLPSPLREIKSLRVLSSRSKSREDQCIDLVADKYDLAIALKYGELYHHIDEELKVVKEMTHEIMDTFNGRLDKLIWLDDTSRTAAKNKLSKIKDYYEYPSWVSNLKKVNEYYEDIETSNAFFANLFNSMRHLQKIELETLVIPREQLKWQESPLKINAFYAGNENHIHILEAILESPTFNVNRLKLMNYASLGFILGHEITHGFDNMGVKYDGEGNLNPWLTDDAQKNFNSRTQCLVDQYSNYELTKEELPGAGHGFRVNGTQTLIENVADDGGLKLSYYSFKKWRANTPDFTLPEYLRKNFTEEQVFFLTFARTWCTNYEHDFEKILATNTHSPDKFRVIGPLSNFDEFAKAFNCPAESKMVRGDKACHVW